MIFKKENGSVKEINEEEFQNILATVAENISNNLATDDLFYKLTIQTLLLKYANDLKIKIFD